MNYFEKLEKDTAIIKALGSEILKSSVDDETILTTLNIVSDTVYRFKIAKEQEEYYEGVDVDEDGFETRRSFDWKW